MSPPGVHVHRCAGWPAAGGLWAGGGVPRVAGRPAGRRGFTLFELMIVVAIIGIVLATGIPSITRSLQKEGMRKAVADFVEACHQARANAILSGQIVELSIQPNAGTFSTSSAGAGGASFSGTLPENVAIELLGINYVDLTEAEAARVKFYPNGTCDEFNMVLLSTEQERCQIRLELMTGLAEVESDPQRFQL